MCTCFRHASQRHTRPKDGKILATRDVDSVQLEAENQEFGDLVQGNFLDTYRLVDFSAHCFVFVLSHKTNKKNFWTQVNFILIVWICICHVSQYNNKQHREETFWIHRNPLGSLIAMIGTDVQERDHIISHIGT